MAHALTRCRRSVPFLAACLAVLVVLTPIGAEAQGHRFEVSGGYALLSIPQVDDTIPTGFYASAGWFLTSWLAILGEVGWSGDREKIGQLQFFVDREVTTILGGTRFVPSVSRRVSPFAEVLVGARRHRVHAAALDRNDPLGFNVTVVLTDFAVQPGGGVTVWFHPRVGLQSAVHYRRTVGRALGDPGERLELPDIEEWRFASGLTVRF